MSPRTLGALACALVAALLSPQAAHAARTTVGSISAPALGPAGEHGSVEFSAQITMGATCLPGEYCRFFPIVTTVDGGQPCAPAISGSSWVGTNVFAEPGMATIPATPFAATWKEWPILYAGPRTACLYAEPDDELVAQVNYTVPAPPPPAPTPTPTPVPQAAPPRPALVTAPVLYNWHVVRTRANLTRLSVSKLPRQATVTVLCSGPGCPIKRRSFSRPSGGTFNVLKALGKHHVFRTGSTLELRLVAANHHAKVLRFHLQRGKVPEHRTYCIPSGGSRVQPSC